MEVNEVITKFQEFVEKNCQTELFENIRLGKHVLIIDFQELCKFNLDVSEELLDKPEETLKAFELAIKNFDIGENANDIKLITVRVKNLPKEQYILIRNIRSSHLGKFIWTEGVVRQKSDVRPQVTSARFECPSCGNIIPVLQLEKKFKEPSRCNCGRNGKFKMISKELVDAQGIVLEESTKDMEGGEQPKRINIFLKNDLVSPMSEKRTNPGNNIRVVGIIKEVPIILKTGGQSTKFDLLIEANCVEGVEEDYSNIEISKEDEERIKVLASDPLIYEKLTSSLAPGIFGHDRVKEALCLQFVGGITKHREDGVKTRGDIHILLIGDPGCGKCVSGETKIITENGEIISVESFYNNQIKNQMELENNATYVNQIMLTNNTAHKNRKIFSINEKGLSETYAPASVCRRKAPQRIIKIVTNTGNEIKVTKEHPLFTTNNGLIFAKEAMEYTIGEYIALPSRIKVNGELQSIADAKNKILKTNANNKVKYNIKEIFDADFARLIGYLLGDGYVKFRKTTGIISFTNNDKDLLDDFEKLMQAVFNVNVSKRKRIGSYEYYASSIELVRILHTIIPSITELSGEKGTSRIITTSPNYVLKEFIKSLFDCEAHVRKDGRVIEFSSKSREMSYNLKYLLLRFGIISQLNSEMKCATNTKLKIKRKYYRLRISGEDVVKYHNHIGFTSKQKQKRLINCINTCKKLNTNIKIVPNIKELLTTLRKKYGLSQFSFPVIRSTYQHYEKGDRFPSYDKLKKLAVFYKNINKEDSLIEILSQISNADIFWDKIKYVEELECKEEYVYDLEINNVHNFVANGVVVHNSQLLKRASVVAPKARYVSGKGVSGAGLCVSPNSLILTNPDGIEAIKDIVEERLITPKKVAEGIWKQEEVKDIKIQGLSNELKIQTQYPEALWKLKSPEKMYELVLSSGKKLEVTGNTQLLTINNGKLTWKKSKEFAKEEYIATPRHLMQGHVKKKYVLDLISSNLVVLEIKHFVKELTKKLVEKYGSIREAAKRLEIKENNLYHNWVVEGARGNLKISALKKIAECVSMQWKEQVKIVSLYNGKPFTLPTYLNEDLLYFAGLVAGDGDIRKSGETYSIRLSNTNTLLHETFRRIIKDEFKLHFDVQKGSMMRPESTRTHSKILAQIMFSLGIPESPKSHRLSLSNNLLCLSNRLLSHYIAGLYDTDGSVVIRKTKGSNCIDLTTCSEKLARQLQLVLLRFNIHATLRKRAPSTGKIKGKYDKWILEIRGIEQIKQFSKDIKLRHPEKRKKLEQQINNLIKGNTNIDIIPNVTEKLKEIIEKNNISFAAVGWRRNLSRTALQQSLHKLNKYNFNDKMQNNDLKEIYNIVFSDIFWERIKSITEKTPSYEYVYDLTVKDTHNFVVDGVLVHNTAAVVKDEFLSGWSLEAGAMVLANKGILMVDELDKMSPEDRDAMHEGLEQQSVSISKANIQATLRCETTVLAAANPKLGRFDPYGTIAGQIDLPPTLISRFDLIFPIKDLPDEEKDTQMATFILELHKMRNTEEPDIPTDLLRKYLVYAKQKMSPQLTDGAIEELKDYYVQMRSSGAGEEKGIKTIPITARQLEGLVRLSEAYAKLRFGDKVTRKDAKKAKGMLEYCLQQVGMDPETGKIDIDRISTGVSTTERSRIVIVREIINELEETLGKNIPLQTVIDAAKEKGIDEDKTMELIEKMKRNGDLFEPKRGEIQKI